MSVDRDKLHYFSQDPIDKVVQEGEITIVNSGVTASYDKARIVEDTIPNLYGRAALARAKWSIDGGTSWQTLESEIVYTYVFTAFSSTTIGLDSAISIGCTDSTVIFRTANGKHGNVGGSPPSTYTPVSRTFTIKYALYERA